MIMNVILWVFLILIILLVVFSLSKATLRLEYKLDGIDDYTVLSASAWGGLIKYRYRLPQKTHNEKTEKKDVEKVSKLDGFFDKLGNIKEVYRVIKFIQKYLAKKLVIRKISLRIEIGTGDACYTGILSGFAWSLAGIVISYFANVFVTREKEIQVIPYFNQEKAVVQSHCIFRIRIVHIIVVGIKLYFHRRAGRKTQSVEKKKSKAVI